MSQKTVSDDYRIENPEEIFSPGLVIFRELLEANLSEMIAIAGDPQRLCPHCKTHKIREIIEIEKQLGIRHHKCATIAEAEMLGDTGVEDVLIAYQLVGPNVQRVVQLLDKFPATRFGCLVDHPDAVQALSSAVSKAGKELYVLIDLNSGMNRTGIRPGAEALELMEMVLSSPGLELDGLHWYDGHHRQSDADERRIAVNSGWDHFTRFRDQALMSGLPVNRVITAGSGSFPILAEKGEPNLQLSPGTTVLFDSGLAEAFPEMNFRPAQGVLTRVVSADRRGFVTLDVGHKSCAADQPAGKRLWFPRFPEAVEIAQTEEHLVIQSPEVDSLKLGDALVAIPRHACPASAVHQFAHVVTAGRFVERWEVIGRDRMLTI